MEVLQSRNEAVEYDEKQRFYDDTTTWLAEVLDGSMRTPFTYSFDGEDLRSHDGGALKPIFQDAITSAEAIVRENPELGFELRRRRIESDEYEEIVSMARGETSNTLMVVSDFPAELMSATKDIGGYNISRKQTMLRVISRASDGTITMRSQSLDKSDREGLETIYRSLGKEPQPGELLGQRVKLDLDETDQELLIDRVMGVYDRTLEARYGGRWYAGRNDTKGVNTYDFVRSQSDLIEGFMQLTSEKPTRVQMRNLAAAMEARFEHSNQPNFTEKDIVFSAVTANLSIDVLQEMERQGKIAEDKGMVFSGCGMTIGKDGNSTLEELTELGYGGESGEDDYGSLTFKCQKGHTNTRPRNQLIEKCKTCGTSVKC